MRRDPSPAAAYAIAVAAVAVTLLIRWPLEAVLEYRLPYITLLPAVLVAACYAGLRAGLLATGRALRYEEAAEVGGRPVHSLTVKFPLRDAAGRVYAVCGIATDITDLKRAEQALRERDEQSRFRAEAGEVLASSLDYEQTLAAV